MTGPTRRALRRRAADLREQADEAAEWSDAERWQAFLTGKHPRTGEPLSDEFEAERQRGWTEYAERVGHGGDR